MLEAIGGAVRTVHLETYILRADRTGRRFADALAAAAGRGLKVRLHYDALGSLGIPGAFLKGMLDAGVEIHEYHPLSLLGKLQKRDHRKILAVDASVAFVGGLNIGDEYAPPEDGGGDWQDLAVRVEGPAAAQADAEFLELWNRERGEGIGIPRVPASPGVRVVSNRGAVRRFLIRRAYLKAIRGAARSVEIQSAYFIPDRRISRALCRAARRGVKVRILIPGESDVPLAAAAGRHALGRLLAAGVRVYRFRKGMFHSKAVAVDRLWCAVGSYNLDHRSLWHNLEANVHAEDAGLGEALGRIFEEDVLRSDELTLEAWHRRPWARRLLDRMAYALRYWL